MTLKEKIKVETIAAMKAKNASRLSALRTISAKILEEEKKPGAKETTDNDIVRIITKLIEQRNTVIDEASKASRQDIIEKETAEKAVYEEFTPKAISKEEITLIIKGIIDSNSYAGMKDMKNVKSTFDAQYPGQEGKVVSEVAMSFLK